MKKTVYSVMVLCAAFVLGAEEGGAAFTGDFSGKTPLEQQFARGKYLECENNMLSLKNGVIPLKEIPEECRIEFEWVITEDSGKSGFPRICFGDNRVWALVRAKGRSQLLIPDPENPGKRTGVSKLVPVELNKPFKVVIVRTKKADGVYSYDMKVNDTPFKTVDYKEGEASKKLTFSAHSVKAYMKSLNISGIKK